MVDSICIVEGEFYTRLLPLVYLRPEYDLRCGILTLREKILKRFPNLPVTLHCRGYLAELVKQQNPGLLINEIKGKSTLFINGRVLMDDKLSKTLMQGGTDSIFVKENSIIAANVSGSKLEELKKRINDLYKLSDFHDLFRNEVDAKLISYPWDLVSNNREQLINDYELLTREYNGNKLNGTIYEGAHLLDKNNIFIDEGTKIMPGAVLDAENGPIYIGKNAKIYSNSVIIGPVFIGNKSQIRVGAKIYENTSIGEVCKVGGEVEDSIIHSYSNKQHEGFLGHAYLGSWVNLGADTNNSDLKNNYGSIKVTINDEVIDSGLQFVGLTMGDHAKSSINSMFNTGTVVGVGSNIFGSGFPPKYVPSFSWGGGETLTTYNIERCLEVAKRVMARRSIQFTEIDEQLMRTVFALTGEERRKMGMPN